MSGECEKCGEHCLDCDCIKNYTEEYLIENASCFVSVESEIIKLACIAKTNETLSGEYVFEKLSRILNRQPIAIHPSLVKLYLRFMLKQKV